MSGHSYMQSVLESRIVMTNMLNIMAQQEQSMNHVLGVPQTPSSGSNEWLQTLLTQMAQRPTQSPNRLPTQAEIQAATRTLLYSEIENPINTECPISHEPFENNEEVTQIRHCGHIFHTNGIRQWFGTGHHCPVCRHDIRATTTSGATQDNVMFEYLFTYPSN